MTPLTSISLLRDLPLKLALPPELEANIRQTADALLPSLQGDDELAALAKLLGLTSRCMEYLDEEAARLVERRFSTLDPAALKQRTIAEPRRQVDALLTQLKAKLANERQEWARRVAKQFATVMTSVENQIDTLQLADSVGHGEVRVNPDEAWLRSFHDWRAETFRRWSDHLAGILETKTQALLEPELTTILISLDARSKRVELPRPTVLNVPDGLDGKKYAERFDIPSVAESVMEMFKGSLSTVAMIAGMVVIPVVGSLMHTASTELRAGVMGTAIAPILVFAIMNGRKARRRLVAQSKDKANEKIRRTILTDLKTQIDRFKPDAERYAANYCGAVSAAVVSAVEPLIARTFEERDRALVMDQAKAQIAADKRARAEHHKTI